MDEEPDILRNVFPVTQEVSDTEYWALVRNTDTGRHHHEPVREVDYSLIDDSNKLARAARDAQTATEATAEQSA